jgi:hypothetical protein
MKLIVIAFFFPFLLQGSSLNTHITFTGEPIVALRTIHNAFNSIGYRLDIQMFSAGSTSGELSAIAIGNRAFNGAALAENLKEENIRIEKARLEAQELDLILDVQDAKWNILTLGSDEGTELKRVAVPQWFQVNHAQRIRIAPPYVGKWYPDVAILNEKMDVVYSYRSSEPKEEWEIELPQGAFYLMVSNAQGMKMMKEGMWIESLNGR